MTPELRYFRDGASFTTRTITPSGNADQVFGADPMRYLITIWNDAADDLTLWLASSPNSSPGFMRVPPGNGPVVLSEDTLGELIRLPFWVQDTAGGGADLTFIAVSYEPRKYDQMRRYTHAKLSGLISL